MTGNNFIMNKRCMVRWFVRWTDSWNREFYEAIESNVHAEFNRMFPSGASGLKAEIDKMRSFYYARMSNTSTLLVAILALIVALLALLVSVVSALPLLFHK